MKLIVNPLASVEILDESDDLISSGPVPGRGMKFLHIVASERPRLHALFKEMLLLGLDSLDIDSDLAEDEIPLLVDHGILVDEDNVPERPLFSCMLDDVEVGPAPSNSLMVNPTLEYLPFDLTKFRSWMQDKHLSPHRPTVWVTDVNTGIRWGYWLSPDEEQAVQSLEPGKILNSAIDSSVASKLYAAGVLVDPNTGDASGGHDLANAAEHFDRDRYVVINGLVPPAQLLALQAYFRKYAEQGFMKFGDVQVERRFVEHDEAVATMVHAAVEPVMSRITGVRLKRTYAYTAVYAEGAELRPHVDRDACEYSFSFQLEYSPEPPDGVSPWPLYISTNPPDDLNVHPSKDRSIHLPNGGFLAYKGRELIHYRTPLPAGHRSASLFFHYVPA